MFNLKQLLLDATAYEHKHSELEPRVLTASRVGDPIPKLVLEKLCLSNPREKFGAASLGSVFHAGMEGIVCSNITESFVAEHSMHYDLPNGWRISGTADLMLPDSKIMNSILS